mmetsp:Transcript_6785/g.6607  ORF Transcript_6785/g.6607 Transcript_6785/m.6607 type:complete len:149 (-) Transcript_6785:714-1160(-)
MHHLPAHIDKLCQCLVRSGTAIHTGDVEKLLLSMTVVDDKFRTEGVIFIVGTEGVSLARQDKSVLIGGELVNDRRFLAIVRVDPSDPDDALFYCRQGVDEVCFTGKGIRVKICYLEECLVAVGMAGINSQKSTEGTILVEDCEDLSGV